MNSLINLLKIVETITIELQTAALWRFLLSHKTDERCNIEIAKEQLNKSLNGVKTLSSSKIAK